MRSRCTWQAVGDALSGVLLVEAALRILGWTLSDWAATYADLPSRQLKVGYGCSYMARTQNPE